MPVQPAADCNNRSNNCEIQTIPADGGKKPVKNLILMIKHKLTIRLKILMALYFILGLN